MSQPSNDTPCSVADCPNQAWHGGLCHAHVKRRQRGLALAKPVRERAPSAWHGLLHAAFALADAAEAPAGDEPGREWQRAIWRYRDALKRYASRKRGARIPYGELWKVARARRS